MRKAKVIEEIANKIKEMSSSFPKEDLEKNLYALLQGAFTKLELVSKDEFDVQTDLLRLTRERLEKVQARLEALESRLTSQADALQKSDK